MNGIYGINEAESYDDTIDESFEESFDQEFEEYEERRRRGQRPPVRTAPRGSAYRPKPQAGYVEQAQLRAALAQIGRQISTNSNAIKTVDGRVRTLVAEQTRMGTVLKKGYGDRKKDILAVRKDLQATREVTALLPLLTLLGGEDNTIGAIAPLLLLGNDVSADPTTGTPAAQSSGFFGGSSTTGLVALLALSGALGK